MRSLIPTFTLALAAVCSLPAQNIPQPRHLIVQIASAPGVPLTENKEEFYYYDNNDNCYQSKTNTWVDPNWVLDTRGYYTLNLAGKPTEILERKWDSAASTLIDNKRTTIGYHTDGQENYRKVETWNASISVWEPGIIQTSAFTPDNKLLEFTYESFNAGMQLYGSRKTYTYDTEGRILELVDQNWDNGIWGKWSKSDFVYNGQDEEYDTIHTRRWDEADSIWAEVTYRQIQTVTGVQKDVLTENLLGGIWTPASLFRNKYDIHNQILEETQESWDAATMDWVVQLRNEYAYNPDQSILQFKVSFRDNNVGILHLFIVVDYDYGSYPVSTSNPKLQARVSVSPNPTADFVGIELEGKEISNITLLDLRGNVLARTTTASSTAQISLANQASGNYLLRVEQGGAVKVLPVTKI